MPLVARSARSRSSAAALRLMPFRSQKSRSLRALGKSSLRKAARASSGSNSSESSPILRFRPSAGMKRTDRTAGNSRIFSITSAGTGSSTSMTVKASPPTRVRCRVEVPMLMPAWPRVLAMWASVPGRSFWRTIMLLNSPVMRTSTPSMRESSAAPPPMETPHARTWLPKTSVTATSTVLGCGVLVMVSGTNSNVRPRSAARSNDSRMRRSSVCKPSKPATRARSVPCPR